MIISYDEPNPQCLYINQWVFCVSTIIVSIMNFFQYPLSDSSKFCFKTTKVKMAVLVSLRMFWPAKKIMFLLLICLQINNGLKNQVYLSDDVDIGSVSLSSMTHTLARKSGFPNNIR